MSRKVTDFQKSRLEEPERKLSEIILSTEAFRDALELWQKGAFSEILTDKRYKSCLTVLSLAMQTVLEKEIEMQELLESIEKGG